MRFLIQKYGQSKRILDDVEGINTADIEVPAIFTSEPRCYGGISLIENEKKLLKFAVYGKVVQLSARQRLKRD